MSHFRGQQKSFASQAHEYTHQVITPKRPPAWNPTYNREYSLSTYIKDVSHWKAATDVQLTQQGSLMVLQLGGLAREFAQELPTHSIQYGGNYDWRGVGPEEIDGATFLLWQLMRQFEALRVEVQVSALLQYQNFHRLPHELIDECLTRFDMLRTRARDHAQYQLGPVGDTHHLLNGMRIPHQEWHRLFDPFGGDFPATEAQLQTLMTRIRKAGHLSESRGSARSELHRLRRMETPLTSVEEELRQWMLYYDSTG